MEVGYVRIGATVLALAGSAALAPRTRAADLAPPQPAMLPAPDLAVSGWYLRGDGTGTYFAKPHDATPANPADPGQPPLVGLRLSHEPGYGGGGGYRVNPWLRVDGTIDQRAPSRFFDTSSRSNFATGYNVEAGKLDVVTGLANVYADLGTWWGLTPYVGAGIGLTKNGFRAAYTQTTCTIAACDGQPGIGTRTAASRESHTATTFAWGLTAGVSYRLIGGLSLDAAYRRLDLGSAATGLDAYGGSTRLKDLIANEVRVGLRYQFAGGLIPQMPIGLGNNPYGN